MRVPCPRGDGSALVVDTGGDGRIRVQWRRWSAEFEAPAGAGRSSGAPAAASLVEDLLAERIAVYTLTDGGRFAACGTLRDERDFGRVLRRLRPGGRLEVASWEGARDEVHER